MATRRSQILYFSPSARERAWGIYVTGAGIECATPNKPYPLPSHPQHHLFEWDKGRRLDEFALLQVRTGQGTVEAENLPATALSRGSVLWIVPGIWHRYRPHNATGWTESWMTFDGTIARQWMEQGLLPSSCIAARSALRTTVDMNFLIRRALQSGVKTKHLSGLCWNVAETFSEEIRSDVQPGLAVRLKRAALLLRNRPHTAIPIAATQVGLAERTFRREFTRFFGLTPIQYSRECVCERAKRMLAETEMPLKAISDELGYGNVFYFMRSFREMTGVTCGEWRKLLPRVK